jgi:CubicO group peptidase (beta-lactamase class C family)
MFPKTAASQWIILHGKNNHTARRVPADTVKTLKELARKGAQFNSLAFAPNGGWIVLHDKNAIFSRNAPTEPVKFLAEQQDKEVELRSIAFTARGGWTAITGNGPFSRDIGEEPFAKLGELSKAGHSIKSISFVPDGGWTILFDKSGYSSQGVPEDYHEKISELSKKNAELRSVTFAPNGGWAILYNKSSVVSNGLPPEAEKALNDLSKKGVQTKLLAFMESSFVPLSSDDQETRDEILFRMNRAEVPGLGMACVNDGKVAWARGYGVQRAKEKTPVTDHTRFQAGAISQLVTAVAALRLVEQQKLKLDDELNARLTSWKVPDNEFTRQKQPTLRQTLSHTAGFNLPAALFRAGSTPTLTELLDGQAETPPIRVEDVPGRKFQQSAGGFCVVQQLLTDVAGKPFPELVRELVLDPAGMGESTFEQPLPPTWEAEAAVGHFIEQQPLAWRWDNCAPALAAAGLWSTPRDLARLIEALSKAQQGKANPILAKAQIQAMFTRQVDNVGLGVRLGGKKTLSFFQTAANTGYWCYLVAFPSTGQGVVLMTNSDSGERLVMELIESLKVEYGWPD